jgi:hypothetical protein
MVRSAVFPVALLIATLPTLAAQTQPPTPPGSSQPQSQVQPGPRGLWLSAGLGYASVDCGNNGCTMGAPSGDLTAGWSLGRKLLLGVGLSGWTKADEFLRVTIGSLGLRARFYPQETIGFFFTGGIGFGLLRLSAGPLGQGNAVNYTGGAFLAGVGCDFHVASHISLTPFATGMAVRTHKDNDDTRADVWQLGLGLTIY